ncbi:MAG: LysR substrate-binding domain-containing protein [Cellvibrionaceae bacterium]
MIERIHLNILCEIERQGSLTAAAKALHLTQSALSHTIKKLEAQLGTPLWSKQGRKIKLTQSGQYLQKEAKRLLPQLERIDEVLGHYAKGEQGSLRIGMECHPCYQWLLKVVSNFLHDHPDVDIDVKQKFQFGGVAALFNHDIDLLVTPDPIVRKGITFTPVFSYEQVLVVSEQHAFSQCDFIEPKEMIQQTLYTYPVQIERLDIYKEFLLPANCLPQKRKTLEATEIMLQLVAANRGVAALPRWLVEQYQQQLPLKAVSLGPSGIRKQIHLGTREGEEEDGLAMSFVEQAF